MSAKNNVGKLGDVLIEDWMIKSPPDGKLSHLQSWRRRYFALLQINHRQVHTVPKKLSKKGPESSENLHDVYLVYWKKDTERKMGEKPIRTIPILKGYTVTECKPPFFENKFLHVLLLDTVDRKFYLSAESEKAKKVWHEALSQAIESRPQIDDSNTLNEPIYEMIQDIMKQMPAMWGTRSSSSASSLSSISDEFDQNRKLIGSFSITSSDNSQSYLQEENLDLNSSEFPHYVVPRPRPRSVSDNDLFSRTHSLARTKDLSDDFLEETSFPLNPKEPAYFCNTNNGRNNNDSNFKNLASMISINKDCGTIVFSDMKLEFPSSSSIEISENVLKVTTSQGQCVLSTFIQKKDQEEKQEDRT